MNPPVTSKKGFAPAREGSVWSPRYRRAKAAPTPAHVRSGCGRSIRMKTAVRVRWRQPRTERTTLEYPEHLSFGKEVLARFEEASAKEWIDTNGRGGYASSTASGANTRKYHGLLVVPHGKGGCRYVMLAKVEETIQVGDLSYELSSNRYPGVIHPEGHLLLSEFRIDPIPTYVYEVGAARLEKRVFMTHESNTVVIAYRLVGAPCKAELSVRPMIAGREFHHVVMENASVESKWKEAGQGPLVYQAYPGVPALYWCHNADNVLDCRTWYGQVEYAVEASRGELCREDLFVPFSFLFTIVPGTTCALIVSSEKSVPPATSADSLEAHERTRRTTGDRDTTSLNSVERSLDAASNTFLLSGKNSRTGVISGYHWSGENCRDTLIAVPGLTLVTGRFDKAKEILSAVSTLFSKGMLPDRFDERTGKPSYENADAALWFIYAVHSYLSYTADYQFVQDSLYDKMIEVIERYRRGTGRGVVMDGDGLIDAGIAAIQMTWMNVTAGDEPVTPRHGKAVEVNALWYNALKIVADLAKRFGDDRMRSFVTLATVAKRSFQIRFWNTNGGYLYDCIRDGEPDDSLRPNQIFALSLPYPLFEGARAASIQARVEEELLTPFGLRTLSPHDPRYRGRYEGDATSRDGAYHQGTAWAWLLGPFITAYLRVHGRTPATIEKMRGLIEGFRDHIRDVGLGTVSEIFDGDPPHTPRGCISKALSVAELLRAYREDVLGNRPSCHDVGTR